MRLLPILASLLLATPLVAQQSVTFDLESQQEHWTFTSDWRLFGGGYQGSTSLYAQSPREDNQALAPPVDLTAGLDYTLSVRLNSKGPDRTLVIGVQSASGDNYQLLDTVSIEKDGYGNPARFDFRVPENGAYRVSFIVPCCRTNAKIFVDEVSITGNFNQLPLGVLDYAPRRTIRLAEGVTFPLRVVAEDADGTVASVTYFANNVELGQGQGEGFGYDWQDLAVGVYEVRATIVDDAGGTFRTAPRSFQVEAVGDLVAGYLAGAEAEVRASLFLDDGTLLLGGRFPNLPAGITTVDLPDVDGGDVNLLQLSTDGRQILRALRVGGTVNDLSSDVAGNVYGAAAGAGLISLGSDLQPNWRRPTDLTAIRVDAGPNGTVAVLTDDATDLDEQKLLDVRIPVYDRDGNLLTDLPGATTFTRDLVVDEANQRIISGGYKNIRAITPDDRRLPVDIPVIKARSYDGEAVWTAYDWNGDPNSPRWLNRLDNNMADTRITRLSRGLDGKLYALYEVDGGNHPLRYDPFTLIDTSTVVGGDAYFNFANSNTEPKVFVGRHELATGRFLLGQQFTARLANTKANTVFTRTGAVAANADGRVINVGRSAFGIPIQREHLPGGYLGGAFTLILNPDFTERERVFRLTQGRNRTVALGPDGRFAIGGTTDRPLYQRGAPASPDYTEAENRAWFATATGNFATEPGTTSTTNSGTPEAPQLRVFPNPSSSFVTVDSDHHRGAAELYDDFGRLVRRWATTGPGIRLSLRGLPVGSYQLKMEGTAAVAPLIIQR